MTSYTEEERQAYLSRMQEIGLRPACRELGYPSPRVAVEWCKRYDVHPKIMSLQEYTQKIAKEVSTQDKIALANKIIERAHDMLEVEADPELEPPLSSMDMSRLASTIEKCVRTVELLSGRSTDRVEVVDHKDLELVEMLNEQAAKNAQIKQEV